MKASFCPPLFAVLVLVSLSNARALAAELPQKHEYQKQLRTYLATLTEKDFEHGVTVDFSTPPGSDDPEQQYRHFLFSLMNQPLIGTKRGYPAVNSPANLFELTSIEGAEDVLQPPVWPETIIPLVQWNYAGNPYYQNKALKLRAFTTACVKLAMLDDYLENNLTEGAARSDLLGYHLIILASPYPGFADVLPPEVQQAYLTGLRKLADRVILWGPKGEESHMDMIVPVGLWYTSRALGDPEFAKTVEAYAQKLLTDPAYFHPAGYCLDRGGADIGYQGMANFFSTWLALASNWQFAKDAVQSQQRLRAHLCLPEPNGQLVGPTQFNTRLSSVPSRDQWDWGIARNTFAGLISDDAVYLSTLPTTEELVGATARQAGVFQGHLRENPRNETRFVENHEIISHPWLWRPWQTYNFQASVNYGYEFYPVGRFAQRKKLEAENSPLLKSPFLREANFVHDFSKAFVIAKQPAYSAILHTGPVGIHDPESGFRQFGGPLGFGGGELAAFWTPQGGSLLLGRRGGNSKEKGFDVIEQWRQWPIHAVSGANAVGKVFTSARILKPNVQTDIQESETRVQVSGVLPHEQLGQGKVLEGKLAYSRDFTIRPDRLHIATQLVTHGQDKIAELYETLPVYYYESADQQEQVAVKIEFEVGGNWQEATAEPQIAVTAVRVFRNQGGAKIAFDRPRRVQLSAANWQDQYLTRAECRNILVDLLESPTGPVILNDQRTISYTIEPIAR
jgi:hypothetical protein